MNLPEFHCQHHLVKSLHGRNIIHHTQIVQDNSLIIQR